MADELEQLNSQDQQDEAADTTADTTAGNSQVSSVKSEPVDLSKSKPLPQLDLSKSKPLPQLDLSKSKPLSDAEELPKLDLSKSQPLITNDLQGLIRLNKFQKQLEAAGDPRAEEVRQQAIALGQTLLHPDKDRSALGKAWDWLNRGIISKETMVRMISGMTPEQLDEALSSYEGETPTHAAIREFVRGSTQDIGQLGSSFTSPASFALAGGGALAKAISLYPELANSILGASRALQVAKTAKAVEDVGATVFGAEGLRSMIESGIGLEDLRNALQLQGDPEKWSQFLQGASMAAVGAASGGEMGKAGVEFLKSGVRSSVRSGVRLLIPDTKLLESAVKLHDSTQKIFDQRMKEVDIATKQAEQLAAEAERLRQAEQAGLATRQQVADAETAASKAAANARVAQEALKQAGASRAEASMEVNRLQRKKAQAKAVVADTAKESFQKAIPPASSGPASYTPEDYEIARGYLERHHKNIQEIDSVEDVRDALQEAQREIENKIKPYIEKYADEPITTNVKLDVHNKLSESPNLKFYDKGMKLFDEYDMTDLTVSEAERIRNDLNALNRAVLKRNFWDVATALKADPEFAARYAAAESLRDGIYGALEEKQVEGVREARQDEAAIIRVKNAADKQIKKGEVKIRGSSDAGVVRRTAAKGVQTASKIGGVVLGGAAGHPVIGYEVGRQVGTKLGQIIAPTDLTRNQLVAQSMELETGGRLPKEITGEGLPPVRPEFELPPGLRETYTPPQREFTDLHNELATHYGEPVTQSTYRELEQRFLEDIGDKRQHGVPLDDSEKALLVKVNGQISKDAVDLQKQIEEYQKQQASKTPREASLPDEAEGLLQIPEEKLGPGMSTENGIVHDLAHAIVAASRGIKPADGIRSHLHPENQAAGSLMSAPLDWSDFVDENGRLNLATVRARAADLVATYVAGGVANDLYHDIPFTESHHLGADLRILRDILKRAGFPDVQISRLIAQGTDDVAKILSQPDVRAIIEDHAAVREKGLDTKYHISPERMNQILNDIGIGEEHGTTTGNNTGVIPGNREGTGQNEPRTKGGIPERGTGIVQPEKEGNAAGGPAGKPTEPSNPRLAEEKPEGATEGGQRWEVFDTRTGKVMGSYESAKRAWRKVDKLDNEYGGYRYRVRPVTVKPTEPSNPKLAETAETAEPTVEPTEPSTVEDLTNTEAPFETTDKELPVPKNSAEAGVTPRRIRVHEAGHHVVADAVGFKTIDTISHLHPEAKPRSLAQARWDDSPFRNSSGKIDWDKVKSRFRDLIAMAFGGPIAEELVYGTPVEENPVAVADRTLIRNILSRAGISNEEMRQVYEEEKARVKDILTKDGRLDILKKYTRSREAGIPDTHHMTAGTTQKMLQEIRQGGQNDYDNKPVSRGTGGMGREAIPREEKGTEGGNSSSEEAAAKEGAAAKGVAATARQEEPESPKLSPAVPKERTTGNTGLDEAIRRGGGIPGGVMKGDPEIGLPELTLFHDPQTGTTLALKSETVTPELVRQKIIESRDQYAKAAEAAKPPESPKLAEKEERTKVPILKIPESTLSPAHDTPLKVLRHEWGHVINAHMEDFKPLEILSQEHPIIQRNYPAAAGTIIDYSNAIDPATGHIPFSAFKERLENFLTTYMGGAAADELFEKVPFQKNQSLIGDLHRSTTLLQKLGYSEKESLDRIRAAVEKGKRNLMQHPEILSILDEAANTRYSDTPDTHHATTKDIQDVLQRIDELKNKTPERPPKPPGRILHFP
jgi:hypothetical protein